MEFESKQLALLARAKCAIAEARSVDDLKDIRDKAEAIRAYAKAQGDCFDIQQNAAEVKIRAERRAGELLAETDKQRPGEYKRSHAVTVSPSLADLGVGKMQSSRWQRMAEVPADAFEQHITDTLATKTELTTASVSRLARVTARTPGCRGPRSAAPNRPSASSPTGNSVARGCGACQ